MEKTNASDAFLYLDDIEVYTANPYAKYEAPVTKDLLGDVQYQIILGDVVNAILFKGENNTVSFFIGANNSFSQGTYAIDGDKVVLTFPDFVYTGTLSDDCATITYESVTGTFQFLDLLKNNNFKAVNVAENAERYTEDGTMYYQGNTDESAISGARGAYYCDYYNAGSASSPVGGKGWSLMGGNGDQIQLTNEGVAEGNQALKLKYSSGGNMRYIQWDLYKGTAEGFSGVDKFNILLKNPTGNQVKTKLMVYKTQQVTSATQGAAYRVEKDIVLGAGSNWDQYTLELDPNTTYYGFAILFTSDWTHAGFVEMDMAYYSSMETDPNLMLYAPAGFSFTGTIVPGTANIVIDGHGKARFTCAGAGMDNVAITYEMYVTYNSGSRAEPSYTQFIDFDVNGTIVHCRYELNAVYTPVITVVSATGDLAAYIPANTVFTLAE